MKTHNYLSDIKEICRSKHLTVDEIFEILKTKFSKIWRSTVYRNVEEMTKDWILTKINGIWDKSIYELNKWNHIHLIDSKTWNITDIDIDDLVIPWIPEWFKIDFTDIKIYWNY